MSHTTENSSQSCEVAFPRITFHGYLQSLSKATPSIFIFYNLKKHIKKRNYFNI